jgi:hypothetical protein
MVKPLLQERTPRRTRRPRVSDGAAFTVIVFMLVTEITVAAGPSADRLLRGERLATALGVAASGGVGETAPRASPPPERRRVDRLVAGGVDSSHIRALRGRPERAFAG